MDACVKYLIDKKIVSKKNGEKLYRLLKEKCPINSEIVFFCIGTEKVKGDNIGPLIGSVLKEKKSFLDKYDVKGFLGDNITAKNMEERLKEVPHKNTFIIAIDATLASKTPGTILLRKGPLTPGLGLGRKLKEVGDISIMPVVGSTRYKDNMIKLIDSIPMELIENTSEIVCESIFYAMEKFEKYKIKEQSSVKIKLSDALKIKVYGFILKMMFDLDNVEEADVKD